MATIKTNFEARVQETKNQRTRTRQFVARKQRRNAEEDPARRAKYYGRMAALQRPRGAEAIQGDDDLEAAWFLQAGARIRRAVAYVEASNGGKWEAGTGFLVSPELLLTNQHVIENADSARATQVTFDREVDDTGVPGRGSAFALAPDKLALFSPENELDYALIAVGERVSGTANLEDLGYCVLSNQGDKHALGMNVNIIQHPRGAPKMVALRNNLLTGRTRRTLLYETDTDHGSSGAPVMNDAWELVALHHYGEPFLEKVDDTGQPISVSVNEGVRISAIYDDLEKRLPDLQAEQQVLLRKALDFCKRPAGSGGGPRRLQPPRLSQPLAESAPVTVAPQTTSIISTGAVMSSQSNGQELRVVIPIEVTVRVGGAGVAPVISAAAAVAAPAKTLSKGAEKVPIDQDYTDRSGYRPNFISGLAVPLPTPDAKLAKHVAPLRAGEPNAEAGELKYEHFSIKMHKTKRIALFTATNIDGKRFLDVDRVTGEVKGAEGETWYKDPRISASFFIDQTFYSGWSHLFDRGHLTRRMDPNWGTEEEAERANADTYHFTNCSPQHFRFNQTTKFWQGAERYILENGAIAEDSLNRLCTFQGPIFDDKVDLWADDVQIPSSFFKVVVWKGKKGVRSVGLVVDQLKLLGEERRGLKQAGDAPSDVSEWRVAIKEIEKRTGLDFGNAVRDADTIKEAGQPTVGEARVLMRAADDLLPTYEKKDRA